MPPQTPCRAALLGSTGGRCHPRPPAGLRVRALRRPRGDRHPGQDRLPEEGGGLGGGAAAGLRHAGKVESSQIGVFSESLDRCHLARAQVLERRFSLSEAWGPGAPGKAPEGVGFSTKPPHAIALREPAWAQRGPRRRGSREERRCALSAGDTRAPRSREGAQGLAPHAHRDQASAWGGALPQPGGRGFTTMVREVAGRALAVLSCCRGRGGATGTGEEPGSSSRATGSRSWGLAPRAPYRSPRRWGALLARCALSDPDDLASSLARPRACLRSWRGGPRRGLSQRRASRRRGEGAGPGGGPTQAELAPPPHLLPAGPI
jgi:hypothetical protein